MPRNCATISHLFADNVLIFTNDSEKSLDNLMKLISKYEHFSGQLINRYKSMFLGHKSISHKKKKVILNSKFQEGIFLTK